LTTCAKKGGWGVKKKVPLEQKREPYAREASDCWSLTSDCAETRS
jgi:hypothetical protein